MSDITIEILRNIQDEARKTNARLDATNTGLGSTNDRLDSINQQLAAFRLGSEFRAVVGAIHDLRDVLLEDRKLRDAVANHEVRISQLERRTG